MEKKLFLVVADVETSEYMGRTHTNQITRLVWAADSDEAEKKLQQAVERDDTYGTSIHITNMDAREAID